ncbi:family 16 glycosylhydrolase [Christiangramia forsetii]|uniref:Secreted glycosyl hydrolase, family 16 n=2 Tax=Christiangramia forsetii TaxID=411153 RepID=A0M239_CHRFK|nr:family 16 glycosylhydrolase [Christiangramia forsetii]CAL66684.1 secreted glycosyl hydrolase, family 16 [Christiangramia forsetii KT0803]
MKMRIKILFLSFIILPILGCSKSDDSTEQEPEQEVVDPQEPDITEGYMLANFSIDGEMGHPPTEENWEVEEILTDEFNGASLDEEKWNGLHPVWSGRVPSNFVRENTTQADGNLRLKSTSMVDDLSEVNDPENDVWVAAASMTSKAKSAKPGYYYEASIKASDLSMTSSFWFRIGEYSEIDVIEHLGHSSKENLAERLSYEYAANTHVYGPEQGPEPIGATYEMGTRGREEFHVYGFWWKDATTLLFYLNGEQVMEITPAVPFEEDLYLIFDTEVFTWAGLPKIENLKDDSKNTMLVDFVRTYKPATSDFDGGLVKNGSFNQSELANWYWKGTIALETNTLINDGEVFSLQLAPTGAVLQEVQVEKNTAYTLNYKVKNPGGSAKIGIFDIEEETISSNDSWSSKNLTFNSGDNTKIFITAENTGNFSVYVDGFKLAKQ